MQISRLWLTSTANLPLLKNGCEKYKITLGCYVGFPFFCCVLQLCFLHSLSLCYPLQLRLSLCQSTAPRPTPSLSLRQVLRTLNSHRALHNLPPSPLPHSCQARLLLLNRTHRVQALSSQSTNQAHQVLTHGRAPPLLLGPAPALNLSLQVKCTNQALSKLCKSQHQMNGLDTPLCVLSLVLLRAP